MQHASIAEHVFCNASMLHLAINIFDIIFSMQVLQNTTGVFCNASMLHLAVICLLSYVFVTYLFVFLRFFLYHPNYHISSQAGDQDGDRSGTSKPVGAAEKLGTKLLTHDVIGYL